MDGNLLYILIVGGVAGFLAGSFMKKGYGILINIILGIVGAFVGFWLMDVLGINLNLGNELVTDLVAGFVGAIVILFIGGLLKK